MNNIKNLHQVSTIFFFVLAFAYVFLALCFRNDFNIDISVFIMRMLDIPFALISLLYGGTALYLQINTDEDVTSPWIMVVFAFCIILFASVVFVNFAFPSQI